MLFVELRFFCFFLVVFCVHWTLRENTARKVWLLLCSHFFYACIFIGDPGDFFQHVGKGEWSKLPDGWWFPAVLWGSTALDYAVGLGIAAAQSVAKRRAWLLASLCINLGVLLYFKYFNFFITTSAGFLGWMGLRTSLHTLKIILPYGVSFYTFQSMSYSIDVYRRRLQPVRRILDLAFFISFFPQLVAGPIVRALDFLPQAFVKREWAHIDVRGSCVLFFIGFVKKACVSEFAALFADAFFAGPKKFNHWSAVAGVVFYAVQIYCDFSGYTDMAIATARLLGYELTVNFRFPYFSRDINEFWRRWHISLSTWLRDYLYISLGGNRGTKLFTYRNLLLTMLLGGMWHGASWNFIIWGAMHGVALIVHREWERLTKNAGAAFQEAMKWIAAPLTFYWICLTWIFFRAAPLYNTQTHELKASGMRVAWQAFKAFTMFGQHGDHAFNGNCVWFLLAFAAIHWANARGWLSHWWRRLPDWAFFALLGAGAAVALLFVPAKYQAFIYFQF